MNAYKIQIDVVFSLFLLLFVFIQELSAFLNACYLLAILLYLSLTLLSFTLRRARIFLIVLLCGSILVFGFLIMPYLLYLFPFAVFSLFLQGEKWSFSVYALYAVIAMLPLFFLRDFQMSALYLWIAAFAFIFYMILNKQSYMLLRKEETNEALRIQLENVRGKMDQLETRIMKETSLAKLEERNALSHRIHDELGHSLSGGLIQLEACKAILYKDVDQAALLLNNAIQISQAGIEEIRKTLKETKPAQESLGVTRLKNELSQFESKYKCQTLFYAKGSLAKITQPMWYVFLQNLTEALTNSLKYSDATRIEANLVVLNKVARFEIRDNGVGAEVISKHLGLLGMEERTAKLGGNVIFQGEDGFSIITLIPIS
ncbi:MULTISPECIES: sensor histidine kinase [Listeria]|uniref:sensor histidine kinase n=1 Tax=Listeria TaxID=1637 RepID=UPI000B58AC2F|nr:MULTISPECIES: histidine kinase [Listeria]